MIRSLFRQFATLTGLAVAASSLGMAQTTPYGQGPPSTNSRWRSGSVVYIAGLTNVKQGSSGSLKVGESELIFTAQQVQAEIPLKAITTVFVGDERVATGGTPARLARKIPVFGIGAVVGASTSRNIDVLTVEYLDDHSGRHGAVFEVPKAQADLARQQLAPLVEPAREAVPDPTCVAATGGSALLIAPIEVGNLAVPPEYRVLFYEDLIDELRHAYSGGTVLRDGDQSVGCPWLTLHLSITGFSKGNERLRTSIGPAGLFVGGTKVAYSVRISNNSGTVVFEKNLKSSKHGDADSLSVAQDVARSVSRALAKMNSSYLTPAA